MQEAVNSNLIFFLNISWWVFYMNTQNSHSLKHGCLVFHCVNIPHWFNLPPTGECSDCFYFCAYTKTWCDGHLSASDLMYFWEYIQKDKFLAMKFWEQKMCNFCGGGARHTSFGDLSLLTRDWTCAPCSGSAILTHWTTREIPKDVYLLTFDKYWQIPV